MLVAVVAAGGLGLVATVGYSTLTESVASLVHVDWVWFLLALVAEAGSMAAFARAQRRLLEVRGAQVHVRSAIAVAYAGNAISASLPVVGSEVATAFSFRQFSRRGMDPAVVGWALTVSGIISSFAFAALLAGGALASGNNTATAFGLAGAVVSLLPALAVVAALRYACVRRTLNWLLSGAVGVSRRLSRRPGPDAEHALERVSDRVAGLSLARLDYLKVLAFALWNWVADCLCLACAIRATGTPVPWRSLFLAYGAAKTAGGIGLTPGGLGVIEVAFTAALVAAGVTSHRAVAAVLVYRLISLWLVAAGGWAVMAVITRTTRTAKTPNPDRQRIG
ncbi:MAG TPA: YbhN family protein [Acidimicrobiales bacterium]|nr:YbhN family protein [Acidimicrobiales bacterium]